MEWISVKDRLPESKQKVIFIIRASYAGSTPQIGLYLPKFINQHIEACKIFIGDDGGFNRDYTVSHWMPLPELPNP